ncbi:uncharacterized protein LOC125496441 [Beta vulgaris subsp. vulgaris]|uniref:uncharacterized protein LOC125496441 n=1 Tax=Beta vulgaris subsp. vulgaris TaxID=3555 RepID=UPI002036964A|nr:uncharacterized protein LOC125496441 [Beta vulgaris subsp. vulgaris]
MTLETRDHVLRVCPRAQEVWNLVGIDINIGTHFKTWFKDLITTIVPHQKYTIPRNVLAVFLCWQIWLRRNAWLFRKENTPASVLLKTSHWAATEWFFTQNQPKVGKAPNSSPPNILWTPPPHHQLKINTDAAFLSSTKQVFLGATCRDNNGFWIEGFQLATYTHNAFEAEIKAIYTALKWAKERNWGEVIVETDCLRAKMAILNENTINSHESDLLCLCRELLHGQEGLRLTFNGRGANKLADSIAKDAKEKQDGFNTLCILSAPPPDCIKFYEHDRLNALASLSYVLNSNVT